MNWMRVGAVALVTGACALLVACGSGDVVSDLDFQQGTQLRADPASDKGRIITLGDDFMDVGQNGYVFSVNDGSRNWVQQLAHHYGVKIMAEVDGGWAYAEGSARVDSVDPDNGAPSVKEQVDRLLDKYKLRKNDLIFINGGMHDIVDAVDAHDVDSEATKKAIDAAAKALVAQVARLQKAGAGHIAIVGVYDIGTSPWAEDFGRSEPKEKRGPVTDLTLQFNDSVKGGVPNDGRKIAYLDAAQFYRFIYDDDKRDSYGIKDADKLACGDTAIEVCTKDKALPRYNEYLFADELHFTPRIWRAFGDDDFGSNAYDEVSNMWGRP